jgi:ABC-type nitrate/sulfonate/bicarbonate transport system substrate-binding protein
MKNKVDDMLLNFTESFESFIDLFTILSFTFIVAAYFFGIYKEMNKDNQNAGNYELQEAVSSGKVDFVIPEDAVIIFLLKEGQSDILQFTKKNQHASRYSLKNENTLPNILQRELVSFKNSKNISFVTISRYGAINYTYFYLIERWLVQNGYKEVKIVFN